ncbi:hypothetical protein KSC_048150 [Ktedonobacter sp. SOSP1-52]|nr:hypothetical protein [Ktedonobacter sp. SOSP1-52]GHO65923.1 hypothetical protein KSC_048150 [Ktedonobacter sp. SOSP1-52]
MAQLCHYPGFALEAAAHLFIVAFKYFDRHDTLEAGVVSLVYVRHTTFTDDLPQFVAVKGPSFQVCHNFSPERIYFCDEFSLKRTRLTHYYTVRVDYCTLACLFCLCMKNKGRRAGIQGN